MSTLALLRCFLRTPARTGAVLPSSDRLCRTMVEAARLPRTADVLELGTGTGVLTRHLAGSLDHLSRFVSLEIDAELASIARANLPDIDIVMADAVEATGVLASRQISACDAVLSGLPWMSLPASQRRDLLDVVSSVLQPGGRFVAFSYAHCRVAPRSTRFLAELNEVLADVRLSRTVWRNLPPAYVITARRRTELGVVKRFPCTFNSDNPVAAAVAA